MTIVIPDWLIYIGYGALGIGGLFLAICGILFIVCIGSFKINF